jgi:glycosyltransferase involved in cell wall biosynthesis
VVPSISIIVRTLGKARVAEALESLAAQTRRDFEVVVVDMSGGACDPVLAQIAPRLPSLRVVTLPRSPRPKALNAGIAAASAPAIGILDDDNLYDPEQIELLLAGLASTGASYVYAGVRDTTYDADGRRIAARETVRPFTLDALLSGNFIYATGSAFRKGLWEDAGGYDERLEVLEDWDLLIRARQCRSIESLGLVACESRMFSGIAGASTFHRELARVCLCYLTIHWKHRRLYLRRRPRNAVRGLMRRGRRLLGLCWSLAASSVHNLRDGSRPH